MDRLTVDKSNRIYLKINYKGGDLYVDFLLVLWRDYVRHNCTRDCRIYKGISKDRTALQM